MAYGFFIFFNFNQLPAAEKNLKTSIPKSVWPFFFVRASIKANNDDKVI